MAPPITYKRVEGTYLQPDGFPVAGNVRFIPSSVVLDSVGRVVVNAAPIEVVLDGVGQFAVDLCCTDVTGTTPSGWTWLLTELFPGGRGMLGDPVAFELPSASAGVVDIADLLPVETVAEVYAYASQATVSAVDARLAALEAIDLAAISLHPFLLMGG